MDFKRLCIQFIFRYWSFFRKDSQEITSKSYHAQSFHADKVFDFSVKNLLEQGAGGSRLSVILATQEAKIRRITARSQPGKIVCETLSKNPSQK
jgi:hypothetical protein